VKRNQKKVRQEREKEVGDDEKREGEREWKEKDLKKANTNEEKWSVP